MALPNSSLTPQQLADITMLVAHIMQQNAPPPPPPPAPPAPRAPTLKDLGIAAPTPFNGNTLEYLRFRRECLAYIAADDTQAIFVNDKKKIAFILSYMKEGSAATWAQNYYNGIMAADGTINMMDTLTTFLVSLDASFKDPAEKEHAYKKWISMCQGNLDAGTFLANFEITMNQAGIKTTDVNVVIPQLHEAVDPEVHKGMVRLPVKPATYVDWKEQVLKIDGVERQICKVECER